MKQTKKLLAKVKSLRRRSASFSQGDVRNVLNECLKVQCLAQSFSCEGKGLEFIHELYCKTRTKIEISCLQHKLVGSTLLDWL